jgi:hypothetical protein
MRFLRTKFVPSNRTHEAATPVPTMKNLDDDDDDDDDVLVPLF